MVRLLNFLSTPEATVVLRAVPVAVAAADSSIITAAMSRSITVTPLTASSSTTPIFALKTTPMFRPHRELTSNVAVAGDVVAVVETGPAAVGDVAEVLPPKARSALGSV
jgi:hypothetical protein